MSFVRIYQPVDLAIQTTLSLDNRASHYLAHVLRAKMGDELILFNGQGGEYKAVISHIDKKKVTVNVLTFTAREVEPPIQIQLAQGIARGEKMDFIVQKAVELGVNKIIPLLTERCNVRLDHERLAKRLQHWQGVVVSACEQSGRNRIPELVLPTDLDQWVSSVPKEYCRFVLSPHVEKKLQTDAIPAQSTIVLLIGPEGGLSDEEVTLAYQNGFMPLNLGPRILRTETASIVALAALQARYGDFSD